MNVVIAGYGVVGRAVEAALQNRPDVNVYIDDPQLGWEITEDMVGVLVPVAVVVCVATPMRDDGTCEVDNVRAVFDKYGNHQRYLVKSAVDPMFLQYCDAENVTVSPEFLRGSTGTNPIKDFINQEFAMYGGGEMRWWHELFKPVLPKLEKVSFTSMEQAAFAKYVENTFLATKVTFFNQMYHIYNAMGFEDFDVMVDAICNDPRIGHSHTQVPGPDGKLGYGGHCLPKDMSAIIESGRYCGADIEFLESVRAFNDKYRDHDA
jgi:UDPglucose 6-dehydrogenase